MHAKIRTQWIQIVTQLKSETNTSPLKYICSRHFHPSDYRCDSGSLTRLKPNVIPSLNLNPEKEKPVNIPPRMETQKTAQSPPIVVTSDDVNHQPRTDKVTSVSSSSRKSYHYQSCAIPCCTIARRRSHPDITYHRSVFDSRV